MALTWLSGDGSTTTASMVAGLLACRRGETGSWILAGGAAVHGLLLGDQGVEWCPGWVACGLCGTLFGEQVLCPGVSSTRLRTSHCHTPARLNTHDSESLYPFLTFGSSWSRPLLSVPKRRPSSWHAASCRQHACEWALSNSNAAYVVRNKWQANWAHEPHTPMHIIYQSAKEPVRILLAV